MSKLRFLEMYSITSGGLGHDLAKIGKQQTAGYPAERLATARISSKFHWLGLCLMVLACSGFSFITISTKYRKSTEELITTNAYTDLRRSSQVLDGSDAVLMQLRLELRVQEASKDGHALNFAFSGIPVISRRIALDAGCRARATCTRSAESARGATCGLSFFLWNEC